MGKANPILKFILGFAALVVVITGLKAAQAMVVLILLAIFVAVLCEPPLLWLYSRRVPLGLSILIIISVASAVIVGISAMVGDSVANFIADLPFYQERLTEIGNQFVAFVNGFGNRYDINLSASSLKTLIDPSSLMGFVGNTLSSFGNLMTNFFIVLVMVIFILAEIPTIQSKIHYQSQQRGSNRIAESYRKIGETIIHYFTLKLWVSLLTGVLIGIWLWLVGVDYFVLWALVAFLLNFIPNLGSILAAVPACLLALVQLGLPDALVSGLGFILVNMLIGNVIEPRLMGHGLNLSTLVVFLSLLIWGWVLGPTGMLLSVPLTMAGKIVFENFEETKSIALFLGGPLSPKQLQSIEDSEEE